MRKQQNKFVGKIKMSRDSSEDKRSVQQASETREDVLRFKELAPALRIYEKNLLLRLQIHSGFSRFLRLIIISALSSHS